MTRRVVKVKVCDRCDSVEKVRTLRLIDPIGGRQATFDACRECREAVPLAEWEKLVNKRPRHKSTGGVVVSGAVLEKAKKASRLAPS